LNSWSVKNIKLYDDFQVVNLNKKKSKTLDKLNN